MGAGLVCAEDLCVHSMEFRALAHGRPLPTQVVCLVAASDGVWDNWVYADVSQYFLDPARVAEVMRGNSAEGVTEAFMVENSRRARANFGSQVRAGVVLCLWSVGFLVVVRAVLVLLFPGMVCCRPLASPGVGDVVVLMLLGVFKPWALIGIYQRCVYSGPGGMCRWGMAVVRVSSFEPRRRVGWVCWSGGCLGKEKEEASGCGWMRGVWSSSVRRTPSACPPVPQADNATCVACYLIISLDE